MFTLDNFLTEGVNDPLFKFNFDLILPYDVSSVDAKIVALRCVDYSIPFPEFESEGGNIANSKWYSIVSDDIGNITLTFIEGDDFKVKKYFNDWQSLMVNPDGSYNVPVKYKRDITFIFYDNEKNKVGELTYVNYFPIKIDDVSGATDSEPLKWVITFSGDTIEEHY